MSTSNKAKTSFFNAFGKIKWKHYGALAVIVAITVIFGSMSATGNLTMKYQVMLEKTAIAMMLAVSLSLVVGFLGELSLGHAGFMCVGMYIGGKLAAVMVNNAGFGANDIFVFFLAVAAGGLSAAALGFIVGLPALRLKGDYLAIVTLAFCQIVRTVFTNSSTESFGGAGGMWTPRMDRKYMFVLEMILLLITVFAVQNIIRSKHGRAITAIRDSEIAAKATGVEVTKYKLLVFVVSSFFAGIAGVLYSYSNSGSVSGVKFDYNYSIEILVMVVLGGMGSINGSLISAAFITYINLLLNGKLTGNLAVLQNIIYAVILILFVIYNNAPALKNFRERTNVRRLFEKLRKPGKKDRAAEKDDEAAWARVPTKIRMDELLSTDLSVRSNRPDKVMPDDDEKSGRKENE